MAARGLFGPSPAQAVTVKEQQTNKQTNKQKMQAAGKQRHRCLFATSSVGRRLVFFV
jgi:hypothetical protein